MSEQIINESEVREAIPDFKRLYTVDALLDLEGELYVELYEGQIVVMFHPTRRHEAIKTEISGQIWQFLKGKSCNVYTSHFGVKPNSDEESLFLPDIVVICDSSKQGDRVYEGAPDFIIEILSPSTALMDKKLKFQKYQKAGVKEYWIVDPVHNLIEANILNNNLYTTAIYTENEKAPVQVLEGFELDLSEVFAE